MRKNSMTILFCLVLCFCVGCHGGSGTTKESAPASITTVGNPGYDSDSLAEVYLTLDQGTDNIRQITDDELVSVLESTSTTIPAVQNFDMGPSGEIVMYFDAEVSVAGQNCILLYSYGESDQCITDDSFEIQDKVRFDQSHNVYYSGSLSGSSSVSLMKWSSETGVATSLLSDGVILTQWIIHGNGTVYLIGTQDGTDIFQSIDSDGTATDLLPQGSQITDMNFIDSDKLIIHGQGITVDEEVASGNFIFDLTANEITETVSYSGGNLTNLLMNSSGHVFVTGDEDSGESNSIYKIYPGTHAELDEIDLDTISFFDLYDDVLYVVGTKDSAAKTIKVDVSLNDYAAESILAGYEVHHMVYDGTNLYLDATNSGNVGVVKYEIASDAITSIESLSNELSQIGSVFSLKNYSFE